MVILDANQWLHKVRDIEIDHAKIVLKQIINIDPNKKISILEIGSGDGYIIDKLSGNYDNFDFLGLEVSSSSYINKSEKVIQYDGKKLDFLNRKFDIIFSVHVIEHIDDLEGHAKQIKNLLNPNGIWINIVPSKTWRFFTTINYYPALIINFANLYKKFVKIKKNKNKAISKFSINPISYLLPQRHGEVGNFITEYFYFSISNWSKIFRKICAKNNMVLLQSSHIPYFYYSRDFFRNLLSDKIRYLLARLFGGSSIIIICKNQSIYL